MDVYQRRRLVALSAIAALFVFFVLLVRGCGGDDEEPTTAVPLSGATGTGTTTTQTLAGYIDQADSICLQANASIAESDPADTEQAAIDEANAIEGELEQIQTLPPPADGADDLDKFLNALNEQATLLSDRVTASERGDTTAIAGLDAEIDEAADDVAKAAKKVGFEACGDPEAVGESTSSTEDDSSDTATGGDTATAPSTATTPVTPAPTTPAVDTATEGGVATEPTTPPADTGTDSASGGISP